jgi:hypothetical protein
MAEGEAATQARPAMADPSTPFGAGLEWMKPLSDMPTKVNAEIFDFAAKRLRAQADLVQGFAACDGPADFFARQAEFLQSSWKDYAEEATKVWDLAQNGLAATTGARK